MVYMGEVLPFSPGDTSLLTRSARDVVYTNPATYDQDTDVEIKIFSLIEQYVDTWHCVSWEEAALQRLAEFVASETTSCPLTFLSLTQPKYPSLNLLGTQPSAAIPLQFHRRTLLLRQRVLSPQAETDRGCYLLGSLLIVPPLLAVGRHCFSPPRCGSSLLLPSSPWVVAASPLLTVRRFCFSAPRRFWLSPLRFTVTASSLCLTLSELTLSSPFISRHLSGFFHQIRETRYLRSKFLGRVDYGRDVSLPPANICNLKIKPRYADPIHTKFVMYAASNGHHLRSDDGLAQEPFLLTLIKETLWGLKSLFVFLVEQPSQLKYIEWPSFSSTLKTATLTLVLVALLIVALSTVDSALCYVLALFLRKAP
ncbi:uncharacterized protein LOC107641007 [Arachis ipaensis]|uniref:uncharacterized protein LOC107641007 n=1 Tax=Arachis ipaensis TaxID=130454 RepID=UPI0007AF0C8B|nr:uncharacterized protein LOC107641007 [Arachis ipaensis]